MTRERARLFLGIEIGCEARETLDSVRRELQEAGVLGKFYSPERYHLTLCFLGDTPTEQIPRIRQVMDGTLCRPFELTLHELGTFKNGAVLWAGVQPNPILTDYRSRLAEALRTAGFLLEEGEYRPHITLARQVKSSIPDVVVPAAKFSVRHAVLFESTRIDDVPCYVPMYRSAFE